MASKLAVPSYTHYTPAEQERKMIDALFKTAASCVQGAMTVLIILIAFGMMLGGKKGAMWVINTAISPIKWAFQKKLTALIYICMFVILSYYLGSKIAHSLGF